MATDAERIATNQREPVPPVGKLAPEPSSDAAGLYVHIPFCETKCGYCDFFSVAMKDRKTRPLVDAVVQELHARVPDAGLPLTTIFCGGGTPTLLPLDELDIVLRAIGDVTRGAAIEEFTVEANPATVEDEKAELLSARGVTRVSMGAQSFFPNELTALERLHSPGDIAPSVQALRRAGIEQINLDLIFGIPGQTVETWRQSLQRAIELEPDHLACYGLTYEPATKLTAMMHAGRVTPCDEGIEADMFECTIDTLSGAGYEQYEISNYARPGCESKHNLIYWRNQQYIGVGPSAAGAYRGRRYKNVPDVQGYVKRMDGAGGAEIETEPVTPVTRILEIILMQLRLIEGIDLARFRQMTGGDARARFEPALSRFVQEGLMSTSATTLALTRKGMMVANTIMAELAACADA